MRAVLLVVLLTASLHAGDYPGSPASVVAAYIEADGEGMALDAETASGVVRFTTWDDVQTGDSFVVIKSYEIGAVAWEGDKAGVEITYAVLGRLDGFKFTPEAKKEEVWFDLVKKKGQWKIVKPKLPPHLTVAGAILAITSTGAGNEPEAKSSIKKLKALE